MIIFTTDTIKKQLGGTFMDRIEDLLATCTVKSCEVWMK